MRGTTAKRYLLREDVAKELYNKVKMGVPIATFLRQQDLQCSRPTLVKLLDAVTLATSNAAAPIKSTPLPDYLIPSNSVSAPYGAWNKNYNWMGKPYSRVLGR